MLYRQNVGPREGLFRVLAGVLTAGLALGLLGTTPVAWLLAAARAGGPAAIEWLLRAYRRPDGAAAPVTAPARRRPRPG